MRQKTIIINISISKLYPTKVSESGSGMEQLPPLSSDEDLALRDATLFAGLK